MSSPDEGDNSDFTEVKDLDKLFERLTITIEKLNSKIDDFAKTTSRATKGSKVDHDKIHKQNMERQKSYFENVEAMKRLSQSFKGGTNDMKMFTGLLTKGASAGLVFDSLTKSINNTINQNEKYKEAHAELQELIEKYGSMGDENGKGRDPRWADASQKDRTRAGKLQEETKGKDKDQLAEKLGGAKEFFTKHKMGMMIGAGSAGVIIGILKKALDASPMFQQIYKLLNFGIMMILRPIGDFFGFLMRPIMIMLLRKFIIPWYTKMYPQMMKWGNEIGTKLAGALTALMNGDIGGAFAQLWGEVDWGAAIWDTIKAVVPIFAVSDFIAGIFGIGNNKWFNEWGRAVGDWFRNGLSQAAVNFSNWSKSVETWFSDGLSRTYSNWNKFWGEIWTWFSDGIEGVAAYWNNLWGTVYGWFWLGIKNIQDNFKGIWETVYNWFWNGIDGIAADWGVIWDNILDWLNPLSENKWGGKEGTNQTNTNNNNDSWSWWAKGGHITEPIMGIGKSGHKYMMGEAGNETVIPDKKLGDAMGGGTTISINIENMSGSQQDLNNLRQTILNVIQESNTRRGRV